MPANGQTDVLRIAPLVVLYGQPGSGKTTQAAMAFPDCFFVLSSPTALRPLASRIAADPECGLRMPKFMVIPEFTPGTVNDPHDNYGAISTLVSNFVKAVYAKRCPYRGLVFDEWSAFNSRIDRDVRRNPKFITSKGTVDGWAVTRELRSFHRWLCAIPRGTGLPVVLICHPRPPIFDDDEKSPTRGQLKYRGGPALTPGTLIEQVCADADVVLHLAITAGLDGAVRNYRTEVDPIWERKFRDFRVKPEEPIGLRELLERADYAV